MEDTIIAISTALGEAGIGIIRVSGPASEFIMKSVMKKYPNSVKNRYAYMSEVINKNNEVIDEAIFILMKKPASYTGEDMLEIQAHGSNVSLKNILSTILELKCKEYNIRIADPGEFTKIAFLNGKMDLSQAEAVIDIIKSKSDITLAIAEEQHQGRLSLTINIIREKILNVLANIAVNIDYPDEDIEQVLKIDLKNSINIVIKEIDKLINTQNIGKIAREGIKIAIVGKPNVGKSSLMNAMLGENRAIVTDMPGTTRDTVEENLTLAGIPLVLIDTAGIRETDNVVEKIGIERAESAIVSADLIIMVFDGSNELDYEDIKIIDFIKNKNIENILLIKNKKDLGIIENDISGKYGIKVINTIETSLTSNSINDEVKIISEAIIDALELNNISPREKNIITNERHLALLKEAKNNLEESYNLIEMDEPLEVSELSLRYAYNILGNIIGEEVGDDVINAVFSKFCLGK